MRDYSSQNSKVTKSRKTELYILSLPMRRKMLPKRESPSDLPDPERLKSDVLVYDRTFQLPGDPGRMQNPFMILMAALPSEQIREVRFKQVPDALDKKQITMTSFKAETWTKPTTFNLFYGFHFPFSVFDVTVWLESLSGNKHILLTCEERIRSVTFSEAIANCIPYFKVHISYSVDISTYQAFDNQTMELLQHMSMPALEYGMLEKRAGERFADKYVGKFGTWSIEPIIKMSNGKKFNPIPVKVDMDKLLESKKE